MRGKTQPSTNIERTNTQTCSILYYISCLMSQLDKDEGSNANDGHRSSCFCSWVCSRCRKCIIKVVDIVQLSQPYTMLETVWLKQMGVIVEFLGLFGRRVYKYVLRGVFLYIR